MATYIFGHCIGFLNTWESGTISYEKYLVNGANSGSVFKIEILSYLYRNSHCEDKIIVLFVA